LSPGAEEVIELAVLKGIRGKDALTTRLERETHG
jgi:hypothetical protein